VLAISEDKPEDSAGFAHDYGIAFPLLSDTDGQVARTYAGMSSDKSALPGVTIIDRNGRIVFRQVASAKDDRMTATQVLAEIDRTLGTSGPAVEPKRFAAIDRLQVRFDLGGGAIDGLATAVAGLSALMPLGHYVLLGVRVAGEPREAPLSLDGVALARIPIWGRAAAIEIGATGGWAPWGDARGPEVGGLADLWFAWTPNWGIQLGIRYTAHHLGDGAIHELAGTLGIGRLIRF
jgi:hypothetical protein